jgi:hypothetical protein
MRDLEDSNGKLLAQWDLGSKSIATPVVCASPLALILAPALDGSYSPGKPCRCWDHQSRKYATRLAWAPPLAAMFCFSQAFWALHPPLRLPPSSSELAVCVFPAP